MTPYDILANVVGISGRRRRHKRRGVLPKSTTPRVPPPKSLYSVRHPLDSPYALKAREQRKLFLSSPAALAWHEKQEFKRALRLFTQYAQRGRHVDAVTYRDLNRREQRPLQLATRALDGFNTRPDICAGRTIRKQVLFASGIAGKAGRSPGGPKGYLHTSNSKVRC